MPGNVQAGRIGVEIGEVPGEPFDRAPHFIDNPVHSRRRGQRVFDHRQIDADWAAATLGQEGVILLVAVRQLPVAAMDEGQGRGTGAGGEEQVDPLARGAPP